MTASSSTSQYVLGSTDAEHERLIRQAARLDPYTGNRLRPFPLAKPVSEVEEHSREIARFRNSQKKARNRIIDPPNGRRALC